MVHKYNLIRGNAAVHLRARIEPSPSPRPWCAGAGGLPHLLPEGDCAYELGCLPELGSDFE